MNTMVEIQNQTKLLADARAELTEVVKALEAEMEAIKRAKLRTIQRLTGKMLNEHQTLASMIETSATLFDKPRTQVFHGIKVGMTKGKGEIGWDDADDVVAKVEKIFPDREDELLNIKKTPDKKALSKLPVADLRRLGCTVTEAGDHVVIEPVDGAVAKIVKALLKGAMAEQEQAAA